MTYVLPRKLAVVWLSKDEMFGSHTVDFIVKCGPGGTAPDPACQVVTASYYC